MIALKIVLPFLLSLLYISSQCQMKAGFRLVDDFKMKDAKVKVYFKDPLEQLNETFSEFGTKPDEEKNRLLEVYLLNHELYVFRVASKNDSVKSYVIRGNPKKVKTSSRYQLDIYNGDVMEQSPEVEKTTDEVNISGEFFQSMTTFQHPKFKKVQTLQIWGNIVHIKPYDQIKETVVKLIELH